MLLRIGLTIPGVCWRWMLVVAVLLFARVADSAPEVKYFYPTGAQKGQTVTVAAGGDFQKWPVNAWVNKPGLHVSAADEKGSLSIAIDADAVPGIYWLRLYDETGAASPKPFIVGPMLEVMEQESNDAPEAAQRLPLETATLRTAVVNGRLGKAGDVDVYAVTVADGQTLVADFDADFPLRSPVDGVLQIVSRDGFVHAQNDDQMGLDPRLAVELPRGGEWLVRVFGFPATPTQSIQFAGDDAYVYRLTISTGPYVDYTIPLTASRVAPTAYALRGWNLPSQLGQLTTLAANDGSLLVSHPEIGNTVSLPVVPHAGDVELEPNALDSPQQITLPSYITGRIDARNDADVFSFPASKGDIVQVRAQSRELGFALDPVLELVDPTGMQLARVDDEGASRDATLTHVAAADGELRVLVSDLHRDGGDRFVYRLYVEKAVPGFALAVESHQAVVAAGATFELPILIERTHGHAEPIRITAQGLPEGVTAPAVVSQAGEDSAAKVTLVFTAAANAKPVSGPLRVTGQAGSAPAQPAAVKLPNKDVQPQDGGIDDFWLTVTAREG
jgi:hypothetical protein